MLLQRQSLLKDKIKVRKRRNKLFDNLIKEICRGEGPHITETTTQHQQRNIREKQTNKNALFESWLFLCRVCLTIKKISQIWARVHTLRSDHRLSCHSHSVWEDGEHSWAHNVWCKMRHAASPFLTSVWVQVYYYRTMSALVVSLSLGCDPPDWLSLCSSSTKDFCPCFRL